MKAVHTKETKPRKTNDSLSDFFLHASAEEKKRVFMAAAQRANEDQRELLKRVQRKAS